MKLKINELFEIAKSELSGLSKVTNPDFRLEQVVYDEVKMEWEVVVSYLVENSNKRTNPLGLPTSEFQFYRIYKKLRINNEKEVVGLFIFDSKE